jgi:hypothetical protein
MKIILFAFNSTFVWLTLFLLFRKLSSGPERCPLVELEDVTASNRWYKTYPKDSWYAENMGLTYEYLKDHMAPDLWTKVNEEYNTYSPGGPLFLYLMLHHLMAANESIATTLSDKIKGEYVGEAVTHLRAIIHRLKDMRRRDVAGNEIDLVPLDLAKRLYKIFQACSCGEFNNLFQNRDYTSSLMTGHAAWSEPEQALTLAQNLYIRLCAENNWNGTDQGKATFPTFKSPKAASTFISQVKRHNCGGLHYLRELGLSIFLALLGCVQPFSIRA